MRALVTGGAGFIGSHLTDRLLGEGSEVRVLDSLEPQVHEGQERHLSLDAELIRADVRDRDAVRRALRGIDRVVHLAAAVGVGQSMYEIEHYVSVNVVGTAVLLEEAANAADTIEKLVVPSSMTVYGEGLYHCPEEDAEVVGEPRTEAQLAERRWDLLCPSCGAELERHHTHEAIRLAPHSVYAITKRDQEELTLAWGRAYGVPATALRLFSVYGPRQALSNPYTGVAAIFAARLLNGKAPIIYEDGRQSRDFVHVSDAVAAIRAALEPGSADGRAVNVGTGRAVSVLEVSAALSAALGSDVEPDVRQTYRAGDIRHCYADIQLARALLGYEPHVPFEEGMGEFVEWLDGRSPADRTDEAMAALETRGLTSS